MLGFQAFNGFFYKASKAVTIRAKKDLVSKIVLKNY